APDRPDLHRARSRRPPLRPGVCPRGASEGGIRQRRRGGRQARRRGRGDGVRASGPLGAVWQGWAKPGRGDRAHGRAVLTTEETVNAFNEAFGAHDVDRVMALMTDDCVFENTLPPPDGERHLGQEYGVRFWETFFRDSPEARFEAEEMIVAGDRAVVRWRFDWGGGHVRGV